MSILELLLRLLWALRPMLSGITAAAAATLLVLPGLLVCCKTTWVRNRSFRIAGLFFGLSGKEILGLTCAWLKLIFVLTFILSFQKLDLLHYWMLFLPGGMAVLCTPTVSRKLSGIFWLVLQSSGLLSVNLVCGYIRDLDGGTGFFLIYVAMGLFLSLFSVYLFLAELGALSAGRSVSARKIWARTEE